MVQVNTIQDGANNLKKALMGVCKPLDNQIPTNDLKHLKRAYMDEIEEPAIGSLSVGNKPVDESKPTEFVTHINAFTTYGSKDNGSIGEIPHHPSEALKTSHDEDIDAPPSTDYLTEQHCKDTQTIDFLRSELKESERKRKMEAESSDTWRNKYIAADRELTKAQVKHDAEVRNLKYEIELLNKALEAHAGDEQLLLLTMKKAVSFAERVKVE